MTAPSPGSFNTLLAVLEHAPAEITELDATITDLSTKLRLALSRRSALAATLAVAQATETQ